MERGGRRRRSRAYVPASRRDLDGSRAAGRDEEVDRTEQSVENHKAISVGLHGNAAEILPELIRRGVRPDAVTDQTSAHDPANGYLPIGWTVEQWVERRQSDPDAVAVAARASMAVHVRAMLDFHEQGIPTFDYGNNIRQEALDPLQLGEIGSGRELESRDNTSMIVHFLWAKTFTIKEPLCYDSRLSP